jgi:hypothetical protein
VEKINQSAFETVVVDDKLKRDGSKRTLKGDQFHESDWRARRSNCGAWKTSRVFLDSVKMAESSSRVLIRKTPASM